MSIGWVFFCIISRFSNELSLQTHVIFMISFSNKLSEMFEWSKLSMTVFIALFPLKFMTPRYISTCELAKFPTFHNCIFLVCILYIFSLIFCSFWFVFCIYFPSYSVGFGLYFVYIFHHIL